MLNLACRHHIHELIIASVFKCQFGASDGPRIALFQKFSSEWETLKTKQFESGIRSIRVHQHLSPIKAELIAFIQDQIQIKQPRNDYLEFLELSLLFLGARLDKNVQIRTPGAVHHARWMAKILYCFKIYLFREHFSVDESTLRAIEDFLIFVLQVYLQKWFTCQVASRAPYNDFCLLRDINNFSVNLEIRQAALTTFLRHQWYISEVLVALSFFDDRVSDEIKNQMKDRLDDLPNNSNCEKKRITIHEFEIADLEFPSFVNCNTMQFFKILDISHDFLKRNAEFWRSSPDYEAARAIVMGLAVTNDNAERAVALVQRYNKTLTNDETTKQNLYQVVEYARNEKAAKKFGQL